MQQSNYFSSRFRAKTESRQAVGPKLSEPTDLMARSAYSRHHISNLQHQGLQQKWKYMSDQCSSIYGKAPLSRKLPGFARLSFS
jgi:hypothetical protein